MRARRVLRRIPQAVIVIVLVLVAGFPVYWMFTTSTHTAGQIFGDQPPVLPDLGRIGAVVTSATHGIPMLRWLYNSAFVAIGTTILSLFFATLAAYGLSRYKFRGKGVFGFVLFATQMLPEALLVVPLYSIFLAVGMLNDLWSLVLSNVAFSMPVAVWIIKSAIDGIPQEIEESARVDGCPRYAILPQVVLPLIIPSIAAAAVMSFFDGWNEYLFANTFITDQQLWPASKGIASFVGQYITPLNVVMSAALIFTVPAIIFFLMVQRRIVSGLTAGSVKG
jgi:multiple sugar transport system permease protein